MQHTFIAKNPSVLWFLLGLSLFTVFVTIFSEAVGSTGDFNIVSSRPLGKTLCLCLVAIAMDVVWGYCGIFEPWTFCLLWHRWLRHRHVADV